MRQVIVVSSLIGSFMVYAAAIDLPSNLVMFLLFGIVPGSERVVPASQMLAAYSTATILVAGYSLRPFVQSAITHINLRRSAQKA